MTQVIFNNLRCPISGPAGIVLHPGGTQLPDAVWDKWKFWEHISPRKALLAQAVAGNISREHNPRTRLMPRKLVAKQLDAHTPVVATDLHDCRSKGVVDKELVKELQEAVDSYVAPIPESEGLETLEEMLQKRISHMSSEQASNFLVNLFQERMAERRVPAVVAAEPVPAVVAAEPVPAVVAAEPVPAVVAEPVPAVVAAPVPAAVAAEPTRRRKRKSTP